MTTPPSNMPEPLSISALSQKLKRTLETEFDFVRVRGELSRIKIHSSGHLYTDLKDDQSVINAVCWRGTVSRLTIKPEEGLEVICTGKITTYPARSNYQLVIDSMELAGEGALLKMLEDRKKRLAAEGLFDAARKKKLPFLPRRIGIVTSPTGAVIRDILHRLSDRMPLPVLVYPANVQGEKAVGDVTTGLRAFAALPDHLRPDVIIIARGGGSLEDLMPFNEEAIVRAIADCPIPVISAIGHETDTTLADFASDQRAPTPTAAAEMAVPVMADLLYTLDAHRQRLRTLLTTSITNLQSRMREYRARLANPQALIDTRQQRLDFLQAQAQHALHKQVAQNAQKLARHGAGLRDPGQLLRHGQEKLQNATQRLHALPARLLEKPQSKLQNTGALLESYSFKKTLARGFALVTDANGHVITHAAQTPENMQLTFADGKVAVKKTNAS